MARDPSLHIKKSRLLDIIKCYGQAMPMELCNYIMDNARPYNLSKRRLFLTNASNKKEYKKVELEVETNDDASNFNQVLNMARKTLRHVFVPITRTDRQWTTIGKLSLVGNQMAIDFNIHKMEAYTAYVRIALRLMAKNYSLNRMLGYRDRIYELYRDECEVMADDKPEATAELTSIYLDEAGRYYGKPFTILPEYKIHFMEARKLADSLDADYTSFVIAQIQGMEFMGAFPDPHQLHSPQSEHRYLTRRKITKSFTSTMGSIGDYME